MQVHVADPEHRCQTLGNICMHADAFNAYTHEPGVFTISIHPYTMLQFLLT